MNPIDIRPHPDAPDHYFAMGKPESWNEEDCGTLCVRRVGVTGDMLVEPAARLVRSQLPSGEEIYPAFQSEWEPSDEEYARIVEMVNAGVKPRFRTLISGNGLPPVAFWLRGEGEV